MTEEVIDAETDNFRISISKMRKNSHDDSIRAVVDTEYKEDNDIPSYDQEIKITGSSASRYAGDIMDINGLDSDEYRSEIKGEILKHKSKIEELAEKRQNRIQENVDRLNDTEPNGEIEELMAEVYRASGPISIEDLEDDHPNVRDIQSANQDLIIRNGQQLLLTEKGEKEAEKILGFDVFEGNVREEAEKQLKNDPIDYYLTAFNRMHKGDHLLKIWELVSALSSTCGQYQINSWALGSSGSGKSHIKRSLAKMLPEDSIKKITSFSPKAFLYKAEKEGADILNNQVVFFDEVDNMDDVVNLMRSITDQDEDTVVHDMVKDQEAYTLTLNVDNLAVWFTSVQTVNDEQLKNRFILTNPDGSSEQDKEVYDHQQKHLHVGSDPDKEPRETPVIKEMINMIRKDTSDLTPIVPFKVNWKQKFNRRLYPYFVTLMGILSKIYYKNRVVKDGYIYVTEADFRLASLIWDRLIDTTVAQTDDESLRLLEKLPDSKSDALTSSELQLKLNGFSTNKVRDKIESMQETEELSLVNSTMENGRYKYWAGGDKQKLVDNIPEIIIDRDLVSDMIDKAGQDPDDDIIDAVMTAEIDIYEELEQQFEEYKNRVEAKREQDEIDVEITEPEKLFLEQANEYEWSTDINAMGQMSDMIEDAMSIAESLEDKDIITIRDDGGSQIPDPTPMYDRAKQEGLL